MSRVQLALNVSDLDDAVDFYTALFGIGPAKVRSGYANFEVPDPPLKLVLIEGGGEPGSLNHLGVEVASSHEVGVATSTLSGRGLETAVESATECCYAIQDKVWVGGPDGERWEVYTVLADAPTSGPPGSVGTGGDGRCCAPGSSPDADTGGNGAAACC